VDQVELAAIEQAQALFKTDYHVNVQPYSGSPANLAVYTALLEPGDHAMAMSLDHGGHLTHGAPVSFTSKVYNFVQYGVNKETELIDYDQVREMALQHKPKLIVCGTTAYSALVDYAAFSRIAKEVGALLMVDMSHVAGLIAGGVHPSPFGIADVVTTTTHKTLRGPRAGMIFCRPEFAKAIDKAIMPGLQGGPHLNTIAAMAIAFIEAQQPSFRQYAKQILTNAKQLAYSLQQEGFRLVANGTDTHLFLVDLRSTKYLGQEAATVLEDINIVCNKNMIPFDENKPTNPSGLRMGTPAVTTRGMKEKEMEQLAAIIGAALRNERSVEELRAAVATLTKKFRIPLHF
ncbi:serine hydroxymethyltransferase, partial [Patescibacteria group bacterium]|nr:serine hydroxymethyltransferase [Patescibacteria group bacterium]